MRFLKFILPVAMLFCSVASRAQQTPPFNSATISGLGARNIGSAAMSGRISAIAGTHEPSGKITLFVGAASGGVWKSDDGGTRYRPVFDEQPVQSIGAIALDPKNAKNVWVGTGESWTRNSVSIGNGIYKSTDGGETWTHAGLNNSERIAQIVVSPKNSDTVYAAVPGALWSDSPDRGLYKTTDGGKTWKQVLKGANLSTGCTEWRSIRRIRTRCSPACGIFGAKVGSIAPAATARTNLRPADCFVRTMAATPGRKLRPRTAKVFRRSRMAGLRSRSRHRTRNAFTASSNRPTARSSFPMTAARRGTSATKAIGWSGVRFISRT